MCAFVLHYPANRHRMKAVNTKTQPSHIHTLALLSASVWTSASTPDSFAHAHLYSPRTLNYAWRATGAERRAMRVEGLMGKISERDFIQLSNENQ